MDWNASAKLQEGRSQAEFTKAAFNWLQANPQASDLERLDFAAKLRDTYIKLFAPDIDITKSPVVNPVGAERPQGSSNMGDLRKSEAMAPVSQKPQPWQTERYFATTADFEAALQERAQAPGNSQLDKLAAKLKVSVQDLILAQNNLYK